VGGLVIRAELNHRSRKVEWRLMASCRSQLHADLSFMQTSASCSSQLHADLSFMQTSAECRSQLHADLKWTAECRS